MNRLCNIGVLLITAVVVVQVHSGESITIAVKDLSAQGVKKSDAAVITEQLRAELVKDARIRMIERSQMRSILEEQGFQQTGCISDACAVEAGQLLGVKHIVVGTIVTAGSYTIITARILDVATGEVVVNKSVRTKGG
jgi:TolB-like protein